MSDHTPTWMQHPRHAVIIAGTRHGCPDDVLAAAIERYEREHQTITHVLSGACKGVDRQGEWWARDTGRALMRYPADWRKHPRAAGPIRNSEMVARADGLIVVRYEGSRGSADVLRKATKAGLCVVDVVLTEPLTDAEIKALEDAMRELMSANTNMWGVHEIGEHLARHGVDVSKLCAWWDPAKHEEASDE